MTVILIRPDKPVEANEEWNFGDAVVGLGVALAVAGATLSVLGFALHILNTNFSFSLVHAVHQTWAWISILVMSVLWLGVGLVHQIRSSSGGLAGREPATFAGEAESGVGCVPLAENQGRGPSHRLGAYREVTG